MRKKRDGKKKLSFLKEPKSDERKKKETDNDFDRKNQLGG